MTLSRRALLRRLPAVPVVGVAAATQGPRLLQRFGEWMQRNQNQYVMPSGPALAGEELAAWRLKWFTEGLQGIAKPSLPMTTPSTTISIDSMRAIVQWERFWEQVEQRAMSYEIPLEQAREIALAWVAR